MYRTDRGAVTRNRGAARWLPGLLLLSSVLGVTAPARADVIELNRDGSVVIRASDRSETAGVAAEPIDLGDLRIPAEALTMSIQSQAPTLYSGAVAQIADANGISPFLLEALVWQESRWQAGARSRAGAIGLTQLMPGTARDLGVNPTDLASNLAGGARYLRQQLDRFDGNVELALAAYNAGPGRVQRSGGIPRILETQNYVRSIVDRLSTYSTPQGQPK